MIDYFRKLWLIRSTRVLLLASLFSVVLSAIRVAYTQDLFFIFLVWNLFLAFVPWFIASLAYIKKVTNWAILAVMILLWLAFFPNAPYILTDLIHLRKGWHIPLWFDLILLLSYGFSGMLYGFVSLRMIELILTAKTGHRRMGILSVPLIYLACFGVYIGRFLRWNSWDLVSNLGSVMQDVYIRIANPFGNPDTWAFTCLFGTLLNILYWSYKSFALKDTAGN